MKIKKLTLILCLFSSSLWAAEDPLTVAVVNFAPPFVFRSGNDVLYGFDVDMMQHLCKMINRTCTFKPLPFKDILPSIQAKEYDVGLGAITITPERANMVGFTIPYMLSESRFLGKSEFAKQPFTLELLENKRIGVELGTVFPQELQSFNIKNVQIENYSSAETMLEALGNDEIDVALLDNATAVYWQYQSSGAFAGLGKPFTYGFGFGLAVNKDNILLMSQLNNAIKQYQESSDYADDYNRYFTHFLD